MLLRFNNGFAKRCGQWLENVDQVKFKYKFQLEPNGAYGSLKNGKWTGMIAELRSQQADMAAIDMSITSIRQQAVDFTMPFMNTGHLEILYCTDK